SNVSGAGSQTSVGVGGLAPMGTARRWMLPAGAAALALIAVAAAYTLGRRQTAATARKGSPVTFSQLTFRQEPIFNARFAPDGKTIVYSGAPSGSSPEIFSMRPDYPGTTPAGRPGMALLSVSSKGELAILTRPRYLRHSLFQG